MTEPDWLACDDPCLLLDHLFAWNRGPTRWLSRLMRGLRRPSQFPKGLDCRGDRKLRLLACACCRRVESHLADERSRRAIEVNERFADGQATTAELADAARGARAATGGYVDDEFVPPSRRLDAHVLNEAAWAAGSLCQQKVYGPSVVATIQTAAWAEARVDDPDEEPWLDSGPSKALRRVLVARLV